MLELTSFRYLAVAEVVKYTLRNIINTVIPAGRTNLQKFLKNGKENRYTEIYALISIFIFFKCHVLYSLSKEALRKHFNKHLNTKRCWSKQPAACKWSNVWQFNQPAYFKYCFLFFSLILRFKHSQSQYAYATAEHQSNLQIKFGCSRLLGY